MIPEGWQAKTLGDVLTLQRGYDLPSTQRKVGENPITLSGGISGWHEKAQATPPGIVTGRYGTIGEVLYVEVDFWPLNTTLYVKDFKGNYPKYLFYLLKTVDFDSHKAKSGVPGVNRNDLHELGVLHPPLEEQVKIAEVLTAWDDALETLGKLIAAKLELKRGLMQALLTGKKTFQEFETREWKTTGIGEVAKVYQPKTIGSDVFTDSGYPVFGANGQVGYFHSFNHEKWQTLVTCRGSTCGTVSRSLEKSWITGNAMVLNVEENQKVDKN